MDSRIASNKRNGAPNDSRRRRRSTDEALKNLNGLRRASGRGRRRSAREGSGSGFLLGALIDFDGALEVGAVFDHDAGGGKIAVDGTILLNLDAVLSAQISLHGAIDHDFTGDNVRG